MPREQINHPKYHKVPGTGECSDGCDVDHAHDVPKYEPEATPLVHVAWNKGGGEWVQVGMQYDKKRLLELLANYPPNDDGTVFLWTEPIDRSACNKLIRTARRARDGAYGRDE